MNHVDDWISSQAKELEWRITWCLAFPTLVPCDIFVDDTDETTWQLVAFQEIFSPTSHESKSELSFDFFENASLGYGEIAYNSVFTIIEWIKEDGWNPVCENTGTLLIDLGSGNGRILFAAALAHNFDKAVGVEIQPELHQDAMENLDKWNQRQLYIVDNQRHDEVTMHKTIFDFYCDDFTRNKFRDMLSEAQLVFIHATVFDETLMECVNEMCHGCCALGTYFVMVTKPLCSTCTLGSRFSTISTRAKLQLAMSWGEATVYIQRKV